jgi:hypothetical protein
MAYKILVGKSVGTRIEFSAGLVQSYCLVDMVQCSSVIWLIWLSAVI